MEESVASLALYCAEGKNHHHFVLSQSDCQFERQEIHLLSLPSLLKPMILFHLLSRFD